MRKPLFKVLSLNKIVGGGQALGELEDGRKTFVWGGLPGETVRIRVTKKKSKFVEGVVEEVLEASPERIAPNDPDSFLSTSPWQIMDFAAEQRYKADLIREAFELHNVALSSQPEVFTDDEQFAYRNKVEFSWYSETRLEDASDVANSDTLDLAFFRRGSKGKIIVDGTGLAHPEINRLAREIRDLLRTKPISARNLKTLLIRCNQQGNAVWQLYLKDEIKGLITPEEAAKLPAQGGEIIYSNPKSPASVITKRLAAFGNTTLTDRILDVPFRYACEGFFQVNIPVYEQALRDMKEWVSIDSRTTSENNSGPGASRNQIFSEGSLDSVDLYSGVGTIGLTIGGDNVTLVEINEHAVREMQCNITQLGKNAQAVLAPASKLSTTSPQTKLSSSIRRAPGSTLTLLQLCCKSSHRALSTSVVTPSLKRATSPYYLKNTEFVPTVAIISFRARRMLRQYHCLYELIYQGSRSRCSAHAIAVAEHSDAVTANR